MHRKGVKNKISHMYSPILPDELTLDTSTQWGREGEDNKKVYFIYYRDITH